MSEVSYTKQALHFVSDHVYISKACAVMAVRESCRVGQKMTYL